MSSGENGVPGWVSALLQGGLLRGKLGPGVLGAIVPIAVAGVVIAGGIVWALKSTPLVAIGCLIIYLAAVIYIIERVFRYAERNPIPALAGGTEIVQLLRDQMSARDKSIVRDEPAIAGSSVPRSIGAGDDDV